MEGLAELLSGSGAAAWGVVVSTVAAGGCGCIGVSLKKLFARMKAQDEGIRSLLRAELERAHMKYCRYGEPLTPAAFEMVDKTYKAYHGIGGNGTGTKLYEDICELDISYGKEERF